MAKRSSKGGPLSMRAAVCDVGLMDKDELVAVALTDGERELLSAGIGHWGGPAHCTQELAAAMGFKDVRDLLDDGRRLSIAVETGAPLSRLDWTRALAAAEIGFGSTVFGAGWDWQAVTGWSDEDTIVRFRKLTGKLLKAAALVGAQHIGTWP